MGNYKKNYYKKNKNEILERGKEKLTCPICDRQYGRSNKSNHDKTKIHLFAVKHLNKD